VRPWRGVGRKRPHNLKLVLEIVEGKVEKTQDIDNNGNKEALISF
jgi:hypothetical protein